MSIIERAKELDKYQSEAEHKLAVATLVAKATEFFGESPINTISWQYVNYAEFKAFYSYYWYVYLVCPHCNTFNKTYQRIDSFRSLAYVRNICDCQNPQPKKKKWFWEK